MTGTLRVSPLAALISGVVVVVATIAGAVTLNVTHTPGVDTLLAVTVPTAASLLVSAGIGAHLRAQDSTLDSVAHAVNGQLAPTVAEVVSGELTKVGLKPAVQPQPVTDTHLAQMQLVAGLLTDAIAALTPQPRPASDAVGAPAPVAVTPAPAIRVAGVPTAPDQPAVGLFGDTHGAGEGP